MDLMVELQLQIAVVMVSNCCRQVVMMSHCSWLRRCCSNCCCLVLLPHCRHRRCRRAGR